MKDPCNYSELYNKSVKTGSHLASSGPLACNPRRQGTQSRLEALEGPAQTVERRGTDTHSGFNWGLGEMGARGCRLRTDVYTVHLKALPPTDLLGPPRSGQPRPHQELRCRLGARRGCNAGEGVLRTSRGV